MGVGGAGQVKGKEWLLPEQPIKVPGLLTTDSPILLFNNGVFLRITNMRFFLKGNRLWGRAFSRTRVNTYTYSIDPVRASGNPTYGPEE